jgi:hypothetical protein
MTTGLVARQRYRVKRVNSTNILDEGLGIGGSRASDELEGKSQSNKACIRE